MGRKKLRINQPRIGVFLDLTEEDLIKKIKVVCPEFADINDTQLSHLLLKEKMMEILRNAKTWILPQRLHNFLNYCASYGKLI
jgi:hypothetical protein